MIKKITRNIQPLFQASKLFSILIKPLSDQTYDMEPDKNNLFKQNDISVAKDISLNRLDYQTYYNQCVNGDIQKLEFPEQRINLYLTSPSLLDEDINIKNTYKLLNKIKPSTILIQASESYKNMQKPNIDHFIQKIYKKPQELIISPDIFAEIKENLLKNMILLGNDINPNIIQSNFNTKSYRLSNTIVSVAGIWSLRNKSPISNICVDMPLNLYIKNIVNSNSLKEIQLIFDACTINNGYISQVYSLFESSVYNYPDIFAYFSDKFMAGAILDLLKTRKNATKNENWLLLCGCCHTKSLSNYIQREDYKYDLKNCLEEPKRFETVIRRETVDMLIEKLAIFEVLSNPHILSQNGEINSQNLSKICMDILRQEVLQELGEKQIKIRENLFIELVKKYERLKSQNIKEGKEKRISELKSHILNQPPKI